LTHAKSTKITKGAGGPLRLTGRGGLYIESLPGTKIRSAAATTVVTL
jgi:hypothetical protein